MRTRMIHGVWVGCGFLSILYPHRRDQTERRKGAPLKQGKTLINFIFIILLSTGLRLYAGGIQEAENPEESSTTIRVMTDSYQRRVEFPRNPGRLVSLGPNMTEIIFALGRGDSLEGRTEWCNYPPQAKQIPSLGSLLEPNIETLAALEPDLVLASTHFQKSSLALLEKLHIPVLVLYGESSFTGVYTTIRLTADALGVQENGENLIADMKKRVEAVQSKVRNNPEPSVYYAISYGDTGDYTAGGNTFINQLISLAGGRNTAADLEGWAYSVEMVLQNDPDIIICPDSPGFARGLKEAPGYKLLRAVKEDRVYTINPDLLDRQGPRLVEGLEILARTLHPEAF